VNCHGGGPRACTSGDGPPSGSPKPTKPTPNQINNAKSVAGTASAFFFGLSFAAGLISKFLLWVSEVLIQWGSEVLLAGPWGFAAGLVLLALGAAATVLAWQANKLSIMLGTLGVMFVGENRMPDSWWTPTAVQAFGVFARTSAIAAGVFVDFASLFARLPVKFVQKFSMIKMTDGALGTGRGLGGAIGFLSGEAIASQIDYYTGLETDRLTQSSCATS